MKMMRMVTKFIAQQSKLENLNKTCSTNSTWHTSRKQFCAVTKKFRATHERSNEQVCLAPCSEGLISTVQLVLIYVVTQGHSGQNFSCHATWVDWT